MTNVLTDVLTPCNDSHMNTPTAAQCKFQPTQLVEVSVVDFKSAGMPRVWASAVVESVTVEGKHFDVRLRMADGRPHVERVGVRGGNQKIRAAA